MKFVNWIVYICGDFSRYKTNSTKLVVDKFTVDKER